MIRVKISPDHKKIRCLIWLVLTLFVLLGYSLQSAAGTAYYSLVTQNYATVGTPQVILQNGTAGTSTIYSNNTSAKAGVEAPLFDYVDNNDPDVDSSADKGKHSNFAAQQAGPDSTYDSLMEENTGTGEGEAIENYVDNNTSDVDSSTDSGIHSNFESQKAKDSSYDTLTEDGGTKNWGQPSQVGIAANVDPYRYMGGTSPYLQGMTITKVHVYIATAGTIAVGVWTGGALDNPVGATKRTESYDVSVIVGWNEIDVPDCSWPANTVTWIGWTNDGTSETVGSSSSSDSGDFQSERGRWEQTSPNPANANVSMPSTIGAGLFNNNYWYSLYIEYEVPYQLDLEVQFTNVIDFLPTEKLCIYAGTLGAEDLNVDFWNGTGWETLTTDLTANSWNNYTVSLTSPAFTIRFKDGNNVGDTTQDQWQIDATLLRVEGTGSKEDAVGNDTSNVDNSDPEDQGTLGNFDNMKTKDGMATLTEALLGGYSLDATGGYMIIGNGTVDWGSTTGTISFWIEWDAVGNRPWGQHDNMETRFSGTSLVVDWGTFTQITSNTSFVSGKWYFIAIVWDEDTDDLYLYVGDLDNAPTEDTHLSLWTYNVSTVGVTQNNFMASKGGVNPTDGHGAYLRYWDVDRSLSAIQSDYKSILTGSETNLKSYYKLDNDFDDIGPNNDDGSASGSYSFSADVPFGPDYKLDQEVQWEDLVYQLPNEEICIYGGTMGDEDIKVDVWNGTGWETVFTDLSSGWNNASITDWLTTSNLTIMFKGGMETGDSSQDTWQIDIALIHIWNESGESYELDLEVQWTNTDFTRTNEELCIKTGTFSGSENIQVKVWNNTGSSWHWLMNLTANQWNNVSITSYLTSSTFTVQFLGGTETGDITQDNWNIDATLLHVWTSASNWLSGWDKRVKITIDHNDIDSDLSDSPVLVYLSNSSGRNNDDVTFVFDEVGSNRKKIAVTESDGTTQCYVEIEKWDEASEQAWLWVKVPSISSTIDTDLYLYFDSSQSDNTAYVGDKESTPAQNVWNTNFKGVWHLDEDPSGTAPQMRDSTSNNNDGNSSGTMTSGDQVAGKIDGSLDFDGTDDYIQTPSNELQTLENFTMAVWFKTDTTTNSHHILWEGPASQNGWGDGSGNPNTHEMHLTICKYDANNTLTFFYGYEESGGIWEPAVEIITPFSDTTNWNHAVVVMTGAGTSPSAELFLNGVSQGTDTGTQTNRTAWDTNLRIGKPGLDQRYFDGMIDEVRILETAKSASWIKASYESGRDDLLDFGAGASEDTSEGTYDYVLRVNNTATTESWEIRLKKYAEANISRLQNCSIYFRNSTDGTSNQILIENGSYISQTGPWYDLGASETIYIAMTVQANSAATSYVYSYLEIRTPNSTTYAQYVITFEIT